MSLQVHQFKCLSDNYGFLIHDPVSGDTASVDTPEADAINAALREKQWKLTHILNTHHHFDHAGGNEMLKAQWGCKIVGFDGEKAGKQAIKEGKIFADPIQYPDRMAEITIQSLVDYFDGKQPEKLIKIPAKLYYKEDADKDPDLK